MFAFKSRTATLAFAAALFFSATLTSPRPAYAADPADIPTVHFHAMTVDGICSLDVMAIGDFVARPLG